MEGPSSRMDFQNLGRGVIKGAKIVEVWSTGRHERGFDTSTRVFHVLKEGRGRMRNRLHVGGLPYDRNV